MAHKTLITILVLGHLLTCLALQASDEQKAKLANANMEQLVTFWNDSQSSALDSELIQWLRLKADPKHASSAAAAQQNGKTFSLLLANAIQEGRSRQACLRFASSCDRAIVTDELVTSVIGCLDDTTEIKRTFCCGVSVTSIQVLAETCLNRHLAVVEPRIIPLLNHPDPIRRVSATRILKPRGGFLSDHATKAILRNTGDTDLLVRIEIAKTLAQCSADFADAANRVLRHYHTTREPELEKLVISSMYSLAPRSSPADRQITIGLLLEQFLSDQPSLSAHYLSNFTIGPEQSELEQILSALIPMLKSERSVEAARVLAARGTDCSAAIEPIKVVMRSSSDIGKQIALARCLYRISKEPSDVLSTYRKALRASNERFVSNAASGAKEMGSDASALVPDLITALDHEKKIVRRTTLRAIEAIGPEAEAAIPKLTELLKSDYKYDVSFSKKAIAAIRREAKK